jgi:hypothetical protein
MSDSQQSDGPLAPGIVPAYRNLGVAPGDYIHVIQSELDRILRETNGNRLKALTLGFERIRQSGLITETDLRRLERVAVTIMGVEQGKQSMPDAVARLDALYLEAVADPDATLMGTTMIGVTYSARTSATSSMEDNERRRRRAVRR